MRQVERLSFSVTHSTDGFFERGHPGHYVVVCPVDIESEAYGGLRAALDRIWQEQAGLEELAPLPRGKPQASKKIIAWLRDCPWLVRPKKEPIRNPKVVRDFADGLRELLSGED